MRKKKNWAERRKAERVKTRAAQHRESREELRRRVEEGESVRVVTYNVQRLSVEVLRCKRTRALAIDLRRMGTDFVCLQEVARRTTGSRPIGLGEYRLCAGGRTAVGVRKRWSSFAQGHFHRGYASVVVLGVGAAEQRDMQGTRRRDGRRLLVVSFYDPLVPQAYGGPMSARREEAYEDMGAF